jgi:ketosteroid isomerase-like protein
VGFLRRFYEIVDGNDTEHVLELLSEDLRFSILFSTEPGGDARDFAGGYAEFEDYMRQRGVPAWTHHVLAESEDTGVELAFGETRQDGAVVATWVAAATLDADGRLSRYMVGRSPAVTFGLGD